ncbi:hypothetical protein FSP39_025040 [Pinctada imbricata]|uniref:Axonemal dynein light chain domain-containing protein 1 n=1 Tax=Pinctada imbricata TaxID=66713 RepID=A0AA88XNZ5_PINIB|nr:hypothetical protein FSP39_025040 [Pinctada imbricata]
MSTTVASHPGAGVQLHQGQGGDSGDQRALMSADKGQILPEIRSSTNAIDKTKPLPTSLQSDFIPEDVLFALTQPPPAKDQLGPPTRSRNLNTSMVQARAPPQNLWNHKRRERFKHLTENTPCLCGAGSDISFLYDVPQPEKKLERPDKIDKSHARKEAMDRQKKPLELPDTLIPDEYHIVKNKGVMGIEFHEDKYSTQIKDHERHLVVFPSMHPGSRFEVIQLKKTLDRMLDKVGINDIDVEIKGPTQMHNLLELIKKEQNIYNSVFHEVIRQTSVECVERGELLADLRKKYSDLLNKVPQQIKSLHEEVMAQRALDRRLTEELMRFKGTISILTSELASVKEHDRKVTKEAQDAREELKLALSESQKNASLLAEYHDLYELQRKRLESSVFMLTEERELWSNAAYSLALKVTEEANLTTAKKLHVSEKSWAKLATHFTILLSDKDTELLTNLQTHVEQWRDLVEEFNLTVKTREEEMKTNVLSLKSGIQRWMHEIRKICFTKEGRFMKSPGEETLTKFLEEMRKWLEVLSKETEKFGGDTLLNGQDQLTLIRKQMDGWTDNALKVFARHRREGNKTHPDQDNMTALNEEVDTLLRQFNNRITGENGVAPHAIRLMHGLESWELKLTSSLNGTFTINDNEWGALCQLMEEWMGCVDDAVQYVGSTQRDDDRTENKPHVRVDVMETVRKVQKWATTASNAIDSEDGRLVGQVATLHSQMVQWMVQMLLRLAPDKEGNSKEAAEMALLNSLSLSELHANVKMLFDQLEEFSDYVALCCSGIVMDNTQARRDNMEENSDHELRDLQRLRTECKEWIHTAQLLTSQLLGESVQSLFPKPVSMVDDVVRKSIVDTEISYHDKEKLETAAKEAESTVSKPPEDGEKKEEKEEEKKEEAPPEQEEEKEMASESLEVIGFDDNTHKKVLDQSPPQPGVTPVASTTAVANAPDTQKSFEALTAVENLQKQLMNTEQRAQLAEDKATSAETELAEAQERIRELEKRLSKYEAPPEQPEEPKTPASEKSTPTPVTPRSPDKEVKKEKEKEEKKRPESQKSSSSKSSKSKKK